MWVYTLVYTLYVGVHTGVHSGVHSMCAYGCALYVHIWRSKGSGADDPYSDAAPDGPWPWQGSEAEFAETADMLAAAAAARNSPRRGEAAAAASVASASGGKSVAAVSLPYPIPPFLPSSEGDSDGAGLSPSHLPQPTSRTSVRVTYLSPSHVPQSESRTSVRVTYRSAFARRPAAPLASGVCAHAISESA